MKQGGRTRSRPRFTPADPPLLSGCQPPPIPPTLKAAMPERGKMKEKVSLPPWLWLHPGSSHGLCFSFAFFFFFLLSCLIYFFITFQFASLVNHYRFVSVSGTASAEQPHELKLAHVCRFGATGQIMGRTHFCSSG